MTIEVGLWHSGTTITVGRWNGASTRPVITGTPTVRDNAAVTIDGTNFPTSGGQVLIGAMAAPINTQSATQIVTTPIVFTQNPMTRTVQLIVIDAQGNQSDPVNVTILPATGQGVFPINTNYLGDPTTRLETTPDDLESGDEIVLRNPTGTGITIADINVAPNAAMDVAASAGSPNVVTVEYTAYDNGSGSRSALWATATWQAAAVLVTVPDIRGMTLEDAQAAAVAAQMSYVQMPSVQSALYPANRVAAQFPPPQSSALIGSVLEITMSLGVDGVLVPNFQGVARDIAEFQRSQLGLTGETYRVIDGNNTGLVTNQSIRPGELVALGTAVDLSYSTNLAPSVIEMELPQALAILQTANLTADPSRSAFSSTVPVVGTVLAQSPVPDTPVAPLATITLTLSLGPIPVIPGASPQRRRIANTYQ